MKLHTIGVAQKSAEEFFEILTGAGVKKVIDVRLNNRSQLLGFSKGRDLNYFCERCHGIKYEHVPLLAPPKELLKKYLDDGDWDYYERAFLEALASRPMMDLFKKARGRVRNICLLCSEPTAENCHRRLVAEYISRCMDNVQVIHL